VTVAVGTTARVDRFALLGAVIAGTLTAGVNAAGPAWMAVPLGLAGPVLVGALLPGAGTWHLVAGLLLAPLLAAAARGELLWLVLLTLPIAAGFTFLLVRIGQRWREPRSTSDPDARGRRIRLAIIVAVAASFIVPWTIADRRMSRDADSRAQVAGERLRRALNRVEPGSVSLFDNPEPLREPGLPSIRSAQFGTSVVRVTGEVSAGWQQRCIRGMRESGAAATIEIMPKGCGDNP
jgi:hypothetical protein